MASVNQNRMAASRRLMKDLEEMKKFPVENISALPLDDNLFEWHCCVVVSDVNFHVILYFPDNYPNSGPSAEFFPCGLQISSGARSNGQKGTKFCLSFLSDYSEYHQEWQKEVGHGWSPSCTTQILLLNICAALSEYKAVELNEELLKDASLSCADCGHTCNNPFPPLPQGVGHTSHIPDDKPEISCYISRDTFSESKKPENKEEVFGFGLEVRRHLGRQYLASPCETLTFGSFQRMKESFGFVQSSIKEEVTQFLPLFIHQSHGECIQDLFEETVDELCNLKTPREKKPEYTMADRIIDVLPNLMASTVEDYTVALEGNINLLNGFFAVHRLLLWACETYPGLQEAIDQRIQDFVEDENIRHKKNCHRTEEWLMLLTVASNKYRWEDVAELYITEVWNRTLFSLVMKNRELVEQQDSGSTATVPQKVFELTAALNKRIALQVIFLTVACPMGLGREDIMRRYDNNLGLPTNEMINEVKEGLTSARGAQSFADWFKIWQFAPISDEEIRLRLVESVQFSISTAGYRTNDSRYISVWKRSINKWKSGKDMSIRQKLVMRTSIPVVKIPELSETQMSTKIPSTAEDAMSQGTADHVNSPSATCSKTVDQIQGPQLMDTNESSSMEEKLNTNLDNAPSLRPNLWPVRTINSLADLRQNRHLQIFKSFSDVGRPRRIKSCCKF